MSAPPATRGRRIGDIVLELGFASEEDVAKATIEHEKTGQPLGQILVELGTITRLELASALAEQWSDQSASIKLLPIPPPASPPRSAPDPHHDDDQYAARLQDAVAELALRVGAGAPDPTEDFDDRVTDLAERVEATVARTQRIEATLATLAESFEGVTGGVEEAFGALQSGMAGLALDLARIDTTVAELTNQSIAVPPVDPELAARLVELGTAVAELANRPTADPATESRLDALAARLDSLAETDEAGELRASLGVIEERIAEIADRPVADPVEVEGRLGALAARVENIVAPDEVVALHDSLVAFEQRLALLAEDAGSTAALDEQARSLAELRETVVELEARSVGDPELDERLARIESQFAERLAAKPDTDQIEALAARLEGLQNQVEGIASTLGDVRQGLTAQQESGAPRRLDELGQSLAAARDEIATLAQAITPADRIEHIAHRVEELTAERQAQQALAQRLNEIESRLTAGVVTPEDLARALIGARDDLTPAPAPLDLRVDELARELASLRDDQAPDHRVNRLGEDMAEVRARLDEMNARAEPVYDPAVHQQLEALATRFEELASASSVAPDPRVDQLAHDFDAIREQLAQAERTPVTDPVVASELDTLSQRLRVLDDRLNEGVATSAEVTQAIEALRTELAGAAAPDPTGPTAEELQRLVDARVEAQVAPQVAERVRELTRDIEERLASAEAQPQAGGSVTGDVSALDDLLERNRMTIERLGLHLGEHDRALAELMQTRSIPKTLQELAARVEEIAGGAPAGGQPAPGTRREIGSLSEPSMGDVRALMRRVEDAEVASRADREKMMSRLERMAASIDWRLQRLEATETHE